MTNITDIKINDKGIIDILEDINTRLTIDNTYNQLIYDYIDTDLKDIEHLIKSNKASNDNDKYLLYYYQMQHNKQARLNLLTDMLTDNESAKKDLDSIVNILMQLQKEEDTNNG